jgi:hypothetical protein
MYSNSLHQSALSLHQARAVQTIDRYWHQLAAGPSIPRRAQIKPSAIQDALDYAFIGERLSGGHTRFRVAGGSVSTVLGMEVAGMPLAVLVNHGAREAFTTKVAQLFDAPRKLTMTLIAPAAFGQPALEAQLRLYPLRGPNGAVSQVLGSFVTTGVIGRTPRRFGLGSVDSWPLTLSTTLPCAPIRTRGHLSLVISNE